MQVQLIPGRSLDAGLVSAWTRLQFSNPELVSPCFAPEFTQAMAAARTNVEVAVIKENGQVTAFFPFQRRGRAQGLPVGGIVSDYEGIIARPDFWFDPEELLKQCRLATWDFDHLPVSQMAFAPFHENCEPSLLMDLSQGYAAYAAERRAAGSKQLQRCAAMARRITREVGPLRFVSHSPDPQALNQVLAWKSRQYLASGWRDLFALPWGRSFVEHIHQTQSQNFAGMLSLLYAGDVLVAGHLGMRSNTVWHYWFPAYNPAFARYSPGLLLLVQMAEHAPALELGTIDLGKGMSLYKQRLMNAYIPLAEGSVERFSWLWLQRTARRKLKSFLEDTLLAIPARRLWAWARGRVV